MSMTKTRQLDFTKKLKPTLTARDARITGPFMAMTALSFGVSEEALALTESVQFEQALNEYFPGASSSTEMTYRMTTFFRNRGYNEKNTLIGSSLCSDEINDTSSSFVTTLAKKLTPPKEGGVFNLGGLGGLPFVGSSGFGAFTSHCPRSGKIIIIFGPHVGISNEGVIGKVERIGKNSPSTSCGAAVGAYTALKAGTVDYNAPYGTRDFQEEFIIQNLRKYLGILAEVEEKGESGSIAYVTKKMYNLIRDIVRQNVEQFTSVPGFWDKCTEVTLLGGILVNRGHGVGLVGGDDLFQPLTLTTIAAQGESDMFSDIFGDLNIPRGSVNSKFDEMKFKELRGPEVFQQKDPVVERIAESTEKSSIVNPPRVESPVPVSEAPLPTAPAPVTLTTYTPPTQVAKESLSPPMNAPLSPGPAPVAEYSVFPVPVPAYMDSVTSTVPVPAPVVTSLGPSPTPASVPAIKSSMDSSIKRNTSSEIVSPVHSLNDLLPAGLGLGTLAAFAFASARKKEVERMLWRENVYLGKANRYAEARMAVQKVAYEAKRAAPKNKAASRSNIPSSQPTLDEPTQSPNNPSEIIAVPEFTLSDAPGFTPIFGSIEPIVGPPGNISLGESSPADELAEASFNPDQINGAVFNPSYEISSKEAYVSMEENNYEAPPNDASNFPNTIPAARPGSDYLSNLSLQTYTSPASTPIKGAVPPPRNVPVVGSSTNIYLGPLSSRSITPAESTNGVTMGTEGYLDALEKSSSTLDNTERINSTSVASPENARQQ